MKEIRNSETLQRWLLESGHLARLWDRPRFFFDAEEFEAELAGVRAQYPQFTAVEAEARAALRLIGKEEGRGRAIVEGGPRRWFPKLRNRERLFFVALLALAVAIALLLLAPRAHAQQVARVARTEPAEAFHNRGIVSQPSPNAPARELLFSPAEPGAGFERYRFYNASVFGSPQGGQPGGIIIRLANSGTVLATTPAGLLQFNCSTGMSCSFAAGSGSNPPTFTLTSTGSGGSGCVPPGSTANALLFDPGSGACSDVSKFTWSNGTSTLAIASGGIFDPTAGTMKVPGSSGQLLFNNAGSLGAEDPIVSGPNATGTAPTANPVQTGALDNSSGCSAGPCVRSFVVANSTPGGSEYGLITRNIPSGTQPVNGTVTANAGSGTFTIQSNASMNLAQVGGASVVTGTGAGGAGVPRVTVSNDSITGQSGLNSSGALAGYLNCDNTAIYDASTNGATQLVALTSGKTIYVCGYQFSTSSSSAVSVSLVYGTGSNCATGQTKITPAYPLQAASSTGPIGLVIMTPGFTGLKTAASNALCINTNAAVSVQAIVWYAGPF